MNIIKFKDGVYNTDNDRFIPNEDINELRLAKALFELLSRKHYENKKECLYIGSILCNIGKGSYYALKYWLDFVNSPKVSKALFSELECIRYWGSFQIRDGNWLEILHNIVQSEVKDLSYDEFLDQYDKMFAEKESNEIEESIVKEQKQEEEEIIKKEDEKKEDLKEELTPPKKLTILEIFDLFIHECITEKEGNMLNFTDFSEVLLPWFEENFPNRKLPKNDNIKAIMKTIKNMPIRKKRGDTLIKTIEKKYGVDLGYRSDMQLHTALKKAGVPSLSKLLTSKL